MFLQLWGIRSILLVLQWLKELDFLILSLPKKTVRKHKKNWWKKMAKTLLIHYWDIQSWRSTDRAFDVCQLQPKQSCCISCLQYINMPICGSSLIQFLCFYQRFTHYNNNNNKMLLGIDYIVLQHHAHEKTKKQTRTRKKKRKEFYLTSPPLWWELQVIKKTNPDKAPLSNQTAFQADIYPGEERYSGH